MKSLSKTNQEEKMSEEFEKELVELAELSWDLGLYLTPKNCTAICKWHQSKLSQSTQKAYQKGGEDMVERVKEVIKDNEWPDGIVDMDGDELRQKLNLLSTDKKEESK